MYVEVTPTLIENTTMLKRLNDETGALISWRITPCEGYVLHTKNYDTPVFDENLEETGEIELGYTAGTISVGYNYNFETNPFEIYAVLESEVPADRIFGGGDNNDHEITAAEYEQIQAEEQARMEAETPPKEISE